MLMRLKFLLLILFLGIAVNFLQAQQTPKTHLWRISGNNFPKPCYLFGTMHSSDKRVYFLGDSVYSSLKYCDGFVMEIDPGEYVDSIVSSLESKDIDISYRQAIENDLVKKSPDYYKRLRYESDSLYNRIIKWYNDLSARDIARLRRLYKLRDRNEMNTSLDLYLFDLAKKQGKIVGGIEDIAGRSAILDEIGNSFDPDEFLKTQRKKYADVGEWILQNYIAAELDKLYEYSKQSKSVRQVSMVLNNRNDVMARRLDSLGKTRSVFCAVGAAHLPGDSGVLNLLRKRGFTVTPVFSSRKIEPGDFKIANQLQSLITITDADSNYMVQMPGKPTMLTGITDKLFVRTYKEFDNEILLMHGLYEDGNINKTVEKDVDEIKTFFSRNDIKLYSATKISRHELDGYDMNFKSQEGYIRMHIFYRKGKTYLFAAGSKYKDSLNSSRCRNYLASYRIFLNKPVSETEMLSFVCPEKAFSISMPVLPKKEIIKGDVTYTNEDITLFSCVDIKKKINYLVLLKEPFKGYFMDFDSSAFVQTLNEVKKGIQENAFALEEIILDGLPAVKVKIKGESDGKSQVIYSVLVIRHNRLYNLTVRGLAIPENELLFDKFINSFHFIPYLESNFEKQVGGNDLFSVIAPSPVYVLKNKAFETGKNKTNSDNLRTDYYAFDDNTAMSYGITSIGFNKYYWADGETALLNEYTRKNFNDSLATNNIFNTDSLVYKKISNNGGIEGRELLLKSTLNDTYTRLRIMHYADSVFIINIKGAQELVTDENADIFFNSFRFIKEKYITDVFRSKAESLIKDLQSTDSSRRSPAIKALAGGFKFPTQDLALVLNALIYEYPVGIPNTISIPSLLALTIIPYANEHVFRFIKEQYPLLKNKREDIREQMINILSASATMEAYQMLKGFLLNDPPASAKYDISLANFSLHPDLASSLFPDLSSKIPDDNLGPIVLALANMLIDSNKIQYSSIINYDEHIIRLARKILKRYQEFDYHDYYFQHTDAVLELLAKMNQKQARPILNSFIDLQNNEINAVIIVAMIKNNLTVSAELMDNFCKIPTLRIQLYDELVKIGKQSSFRGTYANQRSFAEAFAMLYTNNEIPESTPKSFDIVTIKDTLVNNINSRYYVFKVTCRYKYDTKSYPCIIGPFSTEDSNFSIKEGKEVFILYRSKFDDKNIDTLFVDFISKVSEMNK